MKIVLQIGKKKQYNNLLLFVAIPILAFSCKSSKRPVPSPCIAPTSINCGVWKEFLYSSGLNPLLIELAPQIVLPITDAQDCTNNSGVIQIPSVYSNGGTTTTAEFTVLLNCAVSSGTCLCTGTYYIPDPFESLPVMGQYQLSLTCVNKNNHLSDIIISTGEC